MDFFIKTKISTKKDGVIATKVTKITNYDENLDNSLVLSAGIEAGRQKTAWLKEIGILPAYEDVDYEVFLCSRREYEKLRAPSLRRFL